MTWDMEGEQDVAVASAWSCAVPLWGREAANKVNSHGGMACVLKLRKDLAIAN